MPETSGPDQQVKEPVGGDLPPFERGTIAGLVRLHGRAQALANLVAQERDKLLERPTLYSSAEGMRISARARELSTAVTNLQQGAMWLRQVLDAEEAPDASHLERSLRDMLDQATARAERVSVEVKPLDVGAAVREAVEEAAEEARGGVEVAICPRPGWAPIVTHARHVDVNVGELLTEFLEQYADGCPAFRGERPPTTLTSVLIDFDGHVLNDGRKLRDVDLRRPLTLARW